MTATKETQWILITGCSDKTYWYANKVGSIYEMTGETPDERKYTMRESLNAPWNAILKEDAIPVSIVFKICPLGRRYTYAITDEVVQTGWRIDIADDNNLIYSDSPDLGNAGQKVIASDDWALHKYGILELNNPEAVTTEPAELPKEDKGEGYLCKEGETFLTAGEASRMLAISETVHLLKTWDEFMMDIAIGKKTFEVRENNRDFSVTDYLILQGWDKERKRYTGKQIVAEVTYILHGGAFGMDEQYCVMAIKVKNYNF